MRQAAAAAAMTIVAVLAGAVPAHAQQQSQQRSQPVNRFEITPFAGYMAGDEFEDPTDGSERDLEADTSWGVILDMADDPWRHYELLFSSLGTEVDGAVPFDMDVQYLQIGGIVSHPEATRVIPYFGLTVGAARFSPDEPGLDDETKLAFTAGGGLRLPITDRIGVRLDARAFVALLDSDGDLFCASAAGAATCRISAKSDTFLQYAASLGVTIGF